MPLRVTEELAKEIAELRKAAGATQEDVARAVPMKITRLQKLEIATLKEIDEDELTKLRTRLRGWKKTEPMRPKSNRQLVPISEDPIVGFSYHWTFTVRQLRALILGDRDEALNGDQIRALFPAGVGAAPRIEAGQIGVGAGPPIAKAISKSEDDGAP
jgi:transcriptional regulator with XRE-family HTH domain